MLTRGLLQNVDAQSPFSHGVKQNSKIKQPHIFFAQTQRFVKLPFRTTKAYRRASLMPKWFYKVILTSLKTRSFGQRQKICVAVCYFTVALFIDVSV